MQLANRLGYVLLEKQLFRTNDCRDHRYICSGEHRCIDMEGGQSAHEAVSSTAMGLVVASFLWPPATLIIHLVLESGVTSIFDRLDLFREQMTIAALSIVLMNPIVNLFGIPVLITYRKYLIGNKRFPFSVVYIAFTFALAVQYAIYWSLGMNKH
jgi:hypothetical protein